jgi:hypothetical protein
MDSDIQVEAARQPERAAMDGGNTRAFRVNSLIPEVFRLFFAHGL